MSNIHNLTNRFSALTETAVATDEVELGDLRELQVNMIAHNGPKFTPRYITINKEKYTIFHIVTFCLTFVW